MLVRCSGCDGQMETVIGLSRAYPWRDRGAPGRPACSMSRTAAWQSSGAGPACAPPR